MGRLSLQVGAAVQARKWVEISADLNPLGINVSVQDDPLVLVGLVVGHVTESDTDDAFLPLSRLRVQVPIQLIPGHSLSITQVDSSLIFDHF